MCYLDEDSEHGDLYKCIGVLMTETGTVYQWKKLVDREEFDALAEAIGNKLDADKLPEAINTALAQAKESGEFDGEPGTPGTPGRDGQDGKDGTSVTVQSVSESTEPGGNNVVTFSDGKTLTVKNGNDGEPGQPGTPGADYVLTDDDKTEIAQEAADKVGENHYTKSEVDTALAQKAGIENAVYVLKEGESLDDVPDGYALVYDPYATEPEKDYYTKPEIDTMFGSYVNDIAELIGGEAIADS